MTETSTELLQARWKDQQLPHIDGVVYADGRVVLMSGMTLYDGGIYTTTVSPQADTTLASILGYDHDAWVEIGLTDQVEHDGRGRTYRCGAGAMGNEGFVACVEGNQLVWAAFFTCSNPFVQLLPIQDDVLTAVSEYELVWRFPLEAPERVKVGAA